VYSDHAPLVILFVEFDCDLSCGNERVELGNINDLILVFFRFTRCPVKRQPFGGLTD
jgi:hypothetical protein